MQIGVDICKKYRENPQIIHAIEAHHGDVAVSYTHLDVYKRQAQYFIQSPAAHPAGAFHPKTKPTAKAMLLAPAVGFTIYGNTA